MQAMILMCRKLLPKFIGFGLVGAAGFVVDLTALTFALAFVDEVSARVFSFLCAVTATYSLNRYFVFAEEARDLSWLRGFVKFFVSNSLGGAANFATYLALLKFQPILEWTPQLALVAGTLVGLAFNFTLTVLFVFKQKT
ncbi:GtrA family protein [Hirschia litorea]|uniref:GtrA family protein n=1 Tax=Hirschia litorea TaxID=1199156 RepID=A0ABW2IIU4_9PROT